MKYTLMFLQCMHVHTHVMLQVPVGGVIVFARGQAHQVSRQIYSLEDEY